MSTQEHWTAVQYYASLGLIPIPNQTGTKQMRLEHCQGCKAKIQEARASGGRVDCKKCSSCDKLKDITTPERALSHWTDYRQKKPHNVGLLCHTGIMVVDVDLQDDGLSFFNWWAYVRFPEWRTELHTWIATTPKGGYHFYFRYDPAYCGKGGNKVIFSPATSGPVGIDLKIGNVQVLVVPSHIDGTGAYKWLPERSPTDVALASISGSTFDELFAEYHASKLQTPSTVCVANVPVVAVDDSPPQMDQATKSTVLQLLTLVRKQRADPEQQWCDVGFALGRVSYTTEMKEIYRQWSQTSAKYAEAGFETHWAQCDPSLRPHGYAMAALKRWAMEDNPQLYHQQFPDAIPLLDDNSKVYLADMGKIKAKYENRMTSGDVNKVTAEIRTFFRSTVGVVAGKGVLIKLEDEWGWHYDYISINEFKTSFKGDRIYFTDGDGQEQWIDFMDIWQRMKLDQLTFSYVKFQPFSDKNPLPRSDKVLNLFTGLAVEHATRLQVACELEQGIVEYDADQYRQDWEPWYNQTREVVCNNHAESFAYLLDALAWMIQEMGRLGVAILLQGIQGTGKTEWVNFIVSLFGSKYCEVIQREQDTKSEFTGDRRMHLIRVYEDNKGRVLQRMCGEVKNEITAEKVTSRLLFKNKEEVTNWATIFLTINDSCVFDYTEFKRRLLALGQSPKFSSEYPGHDPNFLEHNAFMAKYYRSQKAQVGVYRWLKSRDITSFDQTRVPLTPLMANWRRHNPAPIADFCIRLGSEYGHWMKGGPENTPKGPTTAQLYHAYTAMFACVPRGKLWDRNKLAQELNSFLNNTGVQLTSAKPGRANCEALSRLGIAQPSGNLDGFYDLSLDVLEQAIQEKHDQDFTFGPQEPAMQNDDQQHIAKRPRTDTAVL